MPKFAQISIIKSMRLVLYCVAVLLFVQCSKADLAVSMTDVNINSWYETATIERINEDIESLYDLNIVLHVNNNFSSEDLEFEVTMTSPDAVRHTERIALSCGSGNVIHISATSPSAKNEFINSMRVRRKPTFVIPFSVAVFAPRHIRAPLMSTPM